MHETSRDSLLDLATLVDAVTALFPDWEHMHMHTSKAATNEGGKQFYFKIIALIKCCFKSAMTSLWKIEREIEEVRKNVKVGVTKRKWIRWKDNGGAAQQRKKITEKENQTFYFRFLV